MFSHCGVSFLQVSELAQLAVVSGNDAVDAGERGEGWAGVGHSSLGGGDQFHELKSPWASSPKVGRINFLR